MKLNLKYLFFLNTLAMLGYMRLISMLCKGGMGAGECVKHPDNVLFMIQIVCCYKTVTMAM